MKIYQNIVKSPLFRITSLNSVSVLLKIGIGLITSKIIAVFVGPSGMALVGNFRNFIASLETVATLGLQNGVVKYVAENDRNEIELKKILSTVFTGLLIVALVLSAFLYFAADYWNELIFGSGFAYAFVFKALAIALPWYACSIIVISVINGLGKFKEVVYITIIGNIIGLLLSVLMITQWQTSGALLSMTIAPALLFFAALYFVNKELNFLKFILAGSFSLNVIKNMASYSTMAFVSTVLSPVVFLAIRSDIIQELGASEAGYWEAISRISLYYLMFISTLLTVYFLPQLVKATTNPETKKVVYSYYKNIIPVFAFGLIVLFFLKDSVISILFTEDFAPVSNLFFWQIAGDILKALSLILGYNLIAKKKTGFFIFSELVSMAIMFTASHYLVRIYGIEGVVMAHCVTYAIYTATLAIYSRKILF